MVSALAGWLIWAGVTYLIGAKLLGGTATWGELVRTLGFAQAPGVLSVLGIIPVVGGVVRFAVTIWILIAGVIAIRQALDVSTEKAVLTAVLAGSLWRSQFSSSGSRGPVRCLANLTRSAWTTGGRIEPPAAATPA